MDIALEIRKLPPSSLRELVQILEYNELWKELMSIIPKVLKKDDYECNISVENQAKYNSEHVRLIENASRKLRKACAEILFDEWGTSGRIRPALGHLLYLLVKAELFRAADYVAIKLLRTAPPARPLNGPAALISTTLSDPNSHNGIEVILDNLRYPSSIISDLNSDTQNTSRQRSDVVIPAIVVTDESDNRNLIERQHRTERGAYEMQSMNEQNGEVSDFIRFSEVTTESSRSSNDVPAISSLLHQTGNDNQHFSSDISSSNTDQNLPDFSNLNVNSEKSEQNSINLSSSGSSNNIPPFSTLLETNENQTNSESESYFIPNLSTEKQTNSESESHFIPNLSNQNQVNSDSESNFIPNLSELNNSSLSRGADKLSNSRLSKSTDNIPNLSLFNLPSDNLNSESFNEELPNLSGLNIMNSLKQDSINYKEQIINEQSKSLLNSGSLPHLSSLLSDKNNASISKSSLFIPTLESEVKLTTTGSSAASKGSLQSLLSKTSNSSRRQCVSPLPNLSLNTKLPHFAYHQLEEVTDNFDEMPHQMSCYLEDLENAVGRFLGSGAFGSVYLGIGLLDRPVAVKKLFLNNNDVVDIDDPITKQFKNEVEVLSKYQHENLLSLLGYSCDGPTYCLLYEYIPGGALKDRLQSIEDRLMWTDRLYIAMGTARGISYLHTAYSTPLIHRDIKTANILLDCSNKPKLCDFGIIKLVPNQNTNTSTTVFGTSAYMAPEAFRGDISVKLDTFSFGVVLLELLTSLPPLDESREGCDIVTHVESICENENISPLLDTKAGSWIAKDINFAEKLYSIANKCLLEKKNRPNMVEVTKELSELIELAK